MSTSPAVRAFRDRFRRANDADESEAPATTPAERFEASLALHGLALWMDIERAMRDLGASRPEDVVEEVNRRRLAASPMPPSLRDRRR